MRIAVVGGTRPNFIKIAPLIHALKRHNEQHSPPIEFHIVHTGQHYNAQLSDTFFRELNIPEPQINLDSGSGTQAEQTARIMIRFEAYLVENPMDAVIVVGDVNSTLACSIVAKKLNISLVHIEAGIRSFDRTMPEEINRLVTDALTDYFFTTSSFAGENLKNAGIESERIFFVGNIMIDSLRMNEHKFVQQPELEKRGIKEGNYLVVTLHRPSNVDNKERLIRLLDLINGHSAGLRIIFPVHPRTLNQLSSEDQAKFSNILFCEPMGYMNFMHLVKHARGVITDSGGIQEETTVFGIPCITLRPNTERPETVTTGTNELLPDSAQLPEFMTKMIAGDWKKGSIPEKWDGNTADRIVGHLVQLLQ